jgi:hypothetical protein
MPRSRALRGIGVVLGLLVLGLVLRQLHGYRDELRLSWSQLHWHALAVSVLAFLLAQALFAGCWHRLLAGTGRAGSLRGDVARWCVSLAGKYFPGKVWMAVARLGLYHGAPEGARVAPAFAREMLLSVSAAMALVAAPGWFGQPGPATLTLPFSIGALLLLLLATPTLGQRVLQALQRWTPLRLALPEANAGSLLAAWLLQLAGYVALGLGLVALGQGIGLPVAAQAGTIVAALCFAGLAGIAAFFVPAGIGVREAALAWYLAPVLGVGPATLLAVAARVWISLGEAALVALGLGLLRGELPRVADRDVAPP